MNPQAFCEKYAKKKKNEWGHGANWRKLLAYVLDISEKTVETWGINFENCPDKYRKRLAEIDVLKTAEKVLIDNGLDRHSLDSIE